MDIVATFTPVAIELIDNVFPTDIVYLQRVSGAYDPDTGEIDFTRSVTRALDYDNANAFCQPLSGVDFNNSDAGDGTTSLCDDIQLPAGTAEYDNADILPRDSLADLNGFDRYDLKAGILSRGNVEGGGVGGEIEMRLWVHHGPTGLPTIPLTSDAVLYDNILWKVMNIDPTYASDKIIASKLTVRAS